MVSLKTFRAKIKILKLEAKNDLWDIFRLKLGEKTIVTFGISTLEFADMQKVVQNKQKQIWDQKCLIWVFWDVSLKKYCHI